MRRDPCCPPACQAARHASLPFPTVCLPTASQSQTRLRRRSDEQLVGPGRCIAQVSQKDFVAAGGGRRQILQRPAAGGGGGTAGGVPRRIRGSAARLCWLSPLLAQHEAVGGQELRGLEDFGRLKGGGAGPYWCIGSGATSSMGRCVSGRPGLRPTGNRTHRRWPPPPRSHKCPPPPAAAWRAARGASGTRQSSARAPPLPAQPARSSVSENRRAVEYSAVSSQLGGLHRQVLLHKQEQ